MKVDKEKLEQIALRCDLTNAEKDVLYEIASRKKLNEPLDDEEQCALGKLYPMEIMEYSILWHGKYMEEEILLKKELGSVVSEVHHFGSTAVIGLPAKPVIDILMFVNKGTDAHALKKSLERLGYGARVVQPKPPNTLHIKARKGYTLEGAAWQLYHLHIFESHMTDALLFRDALRADEKLCKEYAGLKWSLANKNAHDRDLYFNGKSEFIRRVVYEAKQKQKPEC
jgi:GrpB-like predicted nucleotidyltransferase (UPF0157 family)